VEVPLVAGPRELRTVNVRLDCAARSIYNACLGRALRSGRRLQESRAFRKIRGINREIRVLLKKRRPEDLPPEERLRLETLRQARRELWQRAARASGFTSAALQRFAVVVRARAFRDHLTSTRPRSSPSGLTTPSGSTSWAGAAGPASRAPDSWTASEGRATTPASDGGKTGQPAPEAAAPTGSWSGRNRRRAFDARQGVRQGSTAGPVLPRASQRAEENPPPPAQAGQVQKGRQPPELQPGRHGEEGGSALEEVQKPYQDRERSTRALPERGRPQAV
jgi:hypothetical protein